MHTDSSLKYRDSILEFVQANNQLNDALLNSDPQVKLLIENNVAPYTVSNELKMAVLERTIVINWDKYTYTTVKYVMPLQVEQELMSMGYIREN